MPAPTSLTPSPPAAPAGENTRTGRRWLTLGLLATAEFMVVLDASIVNIASGLINTSQQVGGAIGLAALATLATSSTRTALHTHTQVAALTTGYTDAFRVAAAITLLAAAITALVRTRRTAANPVPAGTQPESSAP